MAGSNDNVYANGQPHVSQKGTENGTDRTSPPVEHDAECNCEYRSHDVDLSETNGRQQNGTSEKTVRLGYTCPEHGRSTKSNTGDFHDGPLLRDAPAYKPTKKLRVVTLGAGYSGLTFAHKLQHQHPEMQDLVDHVIYDARNDIGGTWLVNTYPGVVCDVPSHIYAFPFDPNPDWSRFYSSGQEIWEYMRKMVDKWNLDRDVKVNHEILSAMWEEDRGQWRIRVKGPEGEFDDLADVFVSGRGFLSHWRWPDIPGLVKFKGHKVHSAAWNHEYDYSNKKIALIGNGSSGIQILPQLAKLRGTQVKSFQRSATWVVAQFSPASLLGKDDPAYNPEYTEEEKRQFREDPKYHNQYRRKIIHSINNGFKMFRKGSNENRKTYETARKQMADKLQHDPDLCKKLIPDYEIGCRRITPGEGYLESFLLPNVELIQTTIAEITESGLKMTDGSFHEVDVIVCATGFDVSYRPPYPMIGQHSLDLREVWSEEPESYMSICAPYMPNYFVFTGPNAVVGHGSLVECMGWTAEYIISWLKKMAEEDIKSITPKTEAIKEFVEYGDEILQTLVWTGSCRSWYKNNRVDGRVTATFGGSALLFKRLIGELRPEDFDVTYRSRNRYRFMGHGFTQYELEEGNDLSWYVKK